MNKNNETDFSDFVKAHDSINQAIFMASFIQGAALFPSRSDPLDLDDAQQSGISYLLQVLIDKIVTTIPLVESDNADSKSQGQNNPALILSQIAGAFSFIRLYFESSEGFHALNSDRVSGLYYLMEAAIDSMRNAASILEEREER